MNRKTAIRLLAGVFGGKSVLLSQGMRMPFDAPRRVVIDLDTIDGVEVTLGGEKRFVSRKEIWEALKP